MARKGTDLFARWLSLGCLAMWIATTVGVSAVQATGATGARAGSSRHKASAAQVIHRPGTTAMIRDVRRTVLPDAVRITIELDGEVPFHDERIESPARVFVDLRSTRATAGLTDKTLRFDGDSHPVHQIRIGRQPGNTTRVVLEAAGVVAYNIYQLYSPYRLVIDCARISPVTQPTIQAKARLGTVPLKTASAILRAPSGERPPPIPPPTPLPLVGRRLADPWSRTVAGTPAAAVVTQPSPVGSRPLSTDAVAAMSTQPAPPSPIAAAGSSTRGSYTMARQLGLGVSRIVIDPGHGGHDHGAQGNDIDEAELVLDVALRLEKLLTKQGTEVVLTRRTDDFVGLQERTAIANREGADLFLSIHANANASPQVRGIETYILNFASNLSAAAVATRENAASGQAMAALPDFVKAIALNNKLAESRELATLVQSAMLERLRGTNQGLKDLGVKQAPFVVLIGAAMPSVLTEISFVTNTQEAKLLKSSPYRQRIAEGLFNAVRKYQTSLKSVSTVAGTRD